MICNVNIDASLNIGRVQLYEHVNKRQRKKEIDVLMKCFFFFQNTYIAPNSHWKGGQIHKDDILTLDHCHPHLMATAGYDGELCVWNLETEKIYLRLRQGQVSDMQEILFD